GFQLDGASDGFVDAVVGSASAQHAVHRLPDLRVTRIRIRIEEHLGRHDLAVHAKAALKCLRIDPRLLNRVRLLRRAESFQRRDVFVRSRGNGSDTRAYRLALHDYRARSALTQTATESRSVKTKVITQGVQQRRR